MSDSTPWVINASPLILLAKLGRTELLDGLTGRILVPEAVVREVAAGGNTGVGLATALDFAKSRTVADIPVPGSILGWDLGPENRDAENRDEFIFRKSLSKRVRWKCNKRRD